MHIYILCSKYLHYFHEIKHYNTPRTCCVGYYERKREQAHIPRSTVTWQWYIQWMARYAFNTQNNSIKGITRYNLPADMHIHSFCFKLKILNNKKLKWPKFADKIKEMEFPGNMHIYTLCFRCLQSFTKFLAVV